MLTQQYKKELAAFRGEMFLIIGALAVVYTLLATRVGVWESNVLVVLSVLPVGILPLWTLWTSLQLYRQEWRENTHYLMLSLPVPAWRVTLPKLMALMTGVVVFTLLLVIGIGWISFRAVEIVGLLAQLQGYTVPFGRFAIAGTMMLLALWLQLLFMSLMVQVAFMLSRLFNKFQGLLMGVLWILQSWVLSKWVGFAAPYLNWLPSIKIPFAVFDAEGTHLMTLIVSGGVFWALLIGGGLLYALLNVTLSKAVEV